MIYLGQDQDQPDAYCCVPTSASMACDAATGGRRRPAVEALRRATGVPHPNGISYIAMTGATMEVSGVKSEARFGLSDAQVVALANSGRPWDASIWGAVTAGTIRSTNGFLKGHTLYCPPNNYRVFIPDGSVCTCEKRITTRHSEFIIQDPGTYQQGFVRISVELLLRAMRERARQAGGTGCNVLVFPDTTDVYREVIEAGWIRQKATTESAKVRRLDTTSRPRHIRRFVAGESWFRPDGGRSTAWAELWDGGYFRADHLGIANVARP